MSEINITPFLTILASIDDWCCQFSNDTQLVQSGTVLSSFMAMFLILGFPKILNCANPSKALKVLRIIMTL